MQIEAKNISFRYSDNQPWILQDVSLKIEEGERVGLIGPSGYGKSTLVKIMSGYLRPTKGEAFAEKRSISCSVDLPASGKSHQSPLEDEKSASGVGNVP